MVFRKDNKVDAFQRQISALRHQLGPDGDQVDDAAEDDHRQRHEPADEYRPAPEEDRPRPRTRYDGEGSGYSFADFGVTSVESTSADVDSETEAARAAIPEIPAVDAHTTVIAGDAVWKGDLESGGPIHVHGRLEGSISSLQDVFVAEGAAVDAAITAVNVVVAGRVTGSIRCQARFEALPQGRVTADVQAPTFVVHEGASLTGGFRMATAESAAAEATPAPIVHRRVARGGA